MPRRRKRRLALSTLRHANAAAHHADTAQHDDHEARREIRQDFRFSIVFTLVWWSLFFAFLDKSSLAEKARWVAFRFIQNHSWFKTKSADENKLPVIVDISNLAAEPLAEKPSEYVTPRAELERLLQALICPDEGAGNGQPAGAKPVPICGGKDNKTGPAVIGVDLDFSPEQRNNEKNGTTAAIQNWQFVGGRDDPEFFNACLNLDVPVFLGVYRTRRLPPDRWLGLPAYRRLATALPIEEKAEHILETNWYSPTFAWALAHAYLSRQPGEGNVPSDKESLPRRLNDLFLERRTEKDVFGIGKSVIDYRALEKIAEFKYREVENNRGKFRSTFIDKIVIIGDVHPAQGESPQRDRFEVPTGESAGVIVQAAAVYTMLSQNGLLMLKQPWEATVDLILACVLHYLILDFRLGGRRQIAELPLLIISFFGGMIAVVLVAFAVSNWILWDGVFVVGASLAFEPLAHLALTKVLQVSRSGVHYVRHRNS